MDHRKIWARSRDELAAMIRSLGYPAEFGNMIAKQLGSPRAIDRMTAYLAYARPDDINLIVDEMLAIQSEMEAWRDKKAAEAANSRYNEILYYGLEEEEDSV